MYEVFLRPTIRAQRQPTKGLRLRQLTGDTTKFFYQTALSSILTKRRKRSFASVANLYVRTSVERDAMESLIWGASSTRPPRTWGVTGS